MSPSEAGTAPVPGAAPTPLTDIDWDGFRDDVRDLRTETDRVSLSARIMLVIGAILVPTGLIIIVLGWWGASRTSNTFEQVPYLISGGLLGLALVFIGGFSYFAHWLTELIREGRRHNRELLAALAAQHDGAANNGRPAAHAEVSGGSTGLTSGTYRTSPRTEHEAERPSGTGSTPLPTTDAPPTVLYATGRGTMAHRADCAVLLNKPDVHIVGDDEALAACKLCDPYG